MKLFARFTGTVLKCSDSKKSVVVSVPSHDEYGKNQEPLNVRCSTDILLKKGIDPSQIVGAEVVICFKYHKKRASDDASKSEFFIYPHVLGRE